MRRLSCNVGISLLSPLGMAETEEDGEYPGMCVYFQYEYASLGTQAFPVYAVRYFHAHAQNVIVCGRVIFMHTRRK